MAVPKPSSNESIDGITSEAWQDALFWNATDAIVLLTSAGEILDWNPAAKQTFGWTKKEALGQKITALLFPHFEASGLDLFITDCGDTPEPKESFSAGMILGIGKNGERLSLQHSVRQINSLNSTTVLATFRDISDITNVTTRLAQLNDCFLSFGVNPRQNIQRLTELCGRLLGARCSYYNHLEGPKLIRVASWNLPPDLPPAGELKGSLCEEVLERSYPGEAYTRGIVDSRKLANIPMSAVKDNTTFLGVAVRNAGESCGVFVALFSEENPPRCEEGQFLGIVASAISIEEERLQSHRKVIESKERLDAVIRSSGQLFYEWNPDTGNVSFSSNVRETLGYELEELGKTLDAWIEFIHTEDAEGFRQEIAEVIATGSHFHKTYRIRKKDGAYIHVEDRGYFVELSAPRSRNFIGFITDVTDRKQTEQALRESQAFLEKSQTVGNIGSWTWGLGTVSTVTWTAETFRIFGCDPGECVPSAAMIFELVHPNDRERVKASVWEAIDNRTNFQLEHRIVGCHGGEVRWLHQRADVILSDDGKPIQLIGVVQDITERKRSEEKLQRSEDYLNSVIENLPLALFSKEADGLKFTLWNRKCEEWFGLTSEEAIGKTDHHFFPKDQADSFIQRDRATLAAGILVDIPEEKITPPGGVTRYLRTRKIPIHDRSGKPISLLGISDDITERKLAESNLRTTQEVLLQAQKLESIGQLAGGVAHDFNNLLAAVLGYSSVLIRELADNPKATERLRAIIQSANRGAELTRQLLGFARKGQYQKKVIAVGGVIEEAKNVLFRSIDKRISIHSGASEGSWAVEADSTQIFQILMNLGLNARDAMPQGGELFLGATNETLDDTQAQKWMVKPGRYTCVHVRDTGVGIPREIIGKVFDPFFTTKEVGKGTGLGLAMVYGIMKNHDGAVVVESEIGSTEFRLYFPAAQSPAAEDTPREEEQNLPVSTSLAGRTILVVDDEPLLRELAKEILVPLGVTVLLAEDGERGLEVFQANRSTINTVIMDVGMPKLNGIETFKRLRQIDERISVLFATGYADNREIHNLLSGERVYFIEKPFSANSLLRKLTDAIGN